MRAWTITGIFSREDHTNAFTDKQTVAVVTNLRKLLKLNYVTL